MVGSCPQKRLGHPPYPNSVYQMHALAAAPHWFVYCRYWTRKQKCLWWRCGDFSSMKPRQRSWV